MPYWKQFRGPEVREQQTLPPAVCLNRRLPEPPFARTRRSAVYLLITPVLEASPGWLREMQGLLWNLVPGLTVLGGLSGWMVAGRRPR